MRTARFYVALMMTLASTWAGQEIKEGPGEIVIPDEIVIRLKPGATLTGVLGSLKISATLVASSTTLPVQVIRVPAALRQTVSTILANHPEIEYVEPHRIRTSTDLTPNDASFASQWWLAKTQAAAAWSLLPGRLTGSVPAANRVRVAILDTGADCTHPDFVDAVGGTSDPTGDSHFASALSIAIVPTTITAPACTWQDDHGHGTHVAGILAAATNNGKGVASVGFPSQLMIYKVMDNTGYGSDFGIANAIIMASDAGARVISMSLGGAGYSQLLQDAVDYAWSKNALVVAAAGNSGNNALFFPAGANYVLGVGATDSSDLRASFSNFGFGLDVMAPGVGILSTYPGNRYQSMSGTSMATPMVSAVAGLIAASTTELASDALAQRIEQSAESKSATGAWDQYYGYGRVNARRGLSGAMRATTTGGLVGQVVNKSGAPVNGAQVRMGGVLITTPATGLFRFGNMATGASVLTVSDGVNPQWSYNVVIPAGADSSLRVKLGVPTGAFTGSVTSNGAAIEGAVVQALQAGLVKASAVTDANGQFTLPVAAGVYDLHSTAVGHAAYTVNAQSIAAGGSAFVAMPMLPLGKIAGTVVDAAGVPLANAQITLESATISTGAVTNTLGEYASLGLPAGAYSVTAASAGYAASVLEGVAVTDGGATAANFQLTSGTGALALITLSQSSIGGGAVMTGNSVTLSAPAGPGGVTVTLSSSNPAIATPPASIMIPAGSLQSTPFSIITAAVGVSTPVTISATWMGVTKTASLTVASLAINSLVLSPAQLGGGVSSAANLITLGSAAPVGGAVIQLTSSNPAVAAVPASVTVPQGAVSSPKFVITTSAVQASTQVTITASFGGSTRTNVLTVNPPSLASLTLSPSSLVGGVSITSATVTLDNVAPAGGAVVTLASADPAARPPASVTVAAGAKVSSVFTIATGIVNVATPVVITATYGGVSKTATVNIKPMALSGLTIPLVYVSGGYVISNVTVRLDGPAPVAGAVVILSSSDAQLAALPTSITIPAGTTVSPAFKVATGFVSVATPVFVTASYGGVSKTVTVNLKPTALSRINASTTPTAGGKPIGTPMVVLDGPAPPGGALVLLTSSNPLAVTPPASVSIAAGATASSLLYIPTGFVSVATPVVITASYGGVSKSITVNVKPADLLKFTVSPVAVKGGVSFSTASVTLDGPAPPAGLAVTLSSSNPAVQPPVNVMVPGGATVMSFTIPTKPVAAATSVTVTATYGLISKPVAVTVNP